MKRYVAFLRGINVGGKKMIKMDALRVVFESAGYQNVRTFIASGNVIFNSPETDAGSLAKKIEKKVLKAFGHDITVIVLRLDELQRVVKSNPFKKIKASEEVMLFVTFFSSELKPKIKLPLESSKENVAVLAIHDGAVFIVARRKSDGHFGFPNAFIEKTFGTRATTRNWNTVQKMAADPNE